MRKILIAYDGSDNSRRAVQHVVELARETGLSPQIHVVNVQHEPIIYGEYVTAAMLDELSLGLTRKAQTVLDEASAALQAGGLSCETHPLLGNVAEQIGDAVKRLGCDTVVMGTRGLGSFTGLLLGSVANRVIHEVSVPVLLVK